MASWDIVVFSKDNTCEYLPSSWAVDTHKLLYLWPKKLSSNQIKRLRDNCTKPTSSIEYEEWIGTCKATVYDIDEARKLAERATYTSNLSSEGEAQHKEYKGEAQYEECDDERSSDTEAEISDDNITLKKHTRSSHMSTPKRQCYDKAEMSKKSRSPITLNDSSQVTYNSSNNSLKRVNSPSVNKEVDQNQLVTELKKMTKALAGIKYDISEIKKDFNEINMKLNILSENSTKRQQFQNFSKFNLPLATEVELNELEEKVKDASSDDFQDLVDILAHVGGLTPKKNVLFIMKKLMNRELSLQYSAHGKKQKKNFSKLNLYNIVLEAVKVNFKSTSDLEITQFISIALATAGDRDGGRNNRVPAENNR